jgi:hypothetical protein
MLTASGFRLASSDQSIPDINKQDVDADTLNKLQKANDQVEWHKSALKLSHERNSVLQEKLGEVQKADDDRSNAIFERNEVRRENTKLRSDIAAAEAHFLGLAKPASKDDAQQEIEYLQEKIRAQESQRKTLQTECDDLERALDAKATDREAINDELNQQRYRYAELAQSYEQLRCAQPTVYHDTQHMQAAFTVTTVTAAPIDDSDSEAEVEVTDAPLESPPGEPTLSKQIMIGKVPAASVFKDLASNYKTNTTGKQLISFHIESDKMMVEFETIISEATANHRAGPRMLNKCKKVARHALRNWRKLTNKSRRQWTPLSNDKFDANEQLIHDNFANGLAHILTEKDRERLAERTGRPITKLPFAAVLFEYYRQGGFDGTDDHKALMRPATLEEFKPRKMCEVEDHYRDMTKRINVIAKLGIANPPFSDVFARFVLYTDDFIENLTRKAANEIDKYRENNGMETGVLELTDEDDEAATVAWAKMKEYADLLTGIFYAHDNATDKKKAQKGGPTVAFVDPAVQKLVDRQNSRIKELEKAAAETKTVMHQAVPLKEQPTAGNANAGTGAGYRKPEPLIINPDGSITDNSVNWERSTKFNGKVIEKVQGRRGQDAWHIAPPEAARRPLAKFLGLETWGATDYIIAGPNDVIYHKELQVGEPVECEVVKITREDGSVKGPRATKIEVKSGRAPTRGVQKPTTICANCGHVKSAEEANHHARRCLWLPPGSALAFSFAAVTVCSPVTTKATPTTNAFAGDPSTWAANAARLSAGKATIENLPNEPPAMFLHAYLPVSKQVEKIRTADFPEDSARWSQHAIVRQQTYDAALSNHLNDKLDTHPAIADSELYVTQDDDGKDYECWYDAQEEIWFDAVDPDPTADFATKAPQLFQ